MGSAAKSGRCWSRAWPAPGGCGEALRGRGAGAGCAPCAVHLRTDQAATTSCPCQQVLLTPQERRSGTSAAALRRRHVAAVSRDAQCGDHGGRLRKATVPSKERRTRRSSPRLPCQIQRHGGPPQPGFGVGARQLTIGHAFVSTAAGHGQAGAAASTSTWPSVTLPASGRVAAGRTIDARAAIIRSRAGPARHRDLLKIQHGFARRTRSFDGELLSAARFVHENLRCGHAASHGFVRAGSPAHRAPGLVFHAACRAPLIRTVGCRGPQSYDQEIISQK